MKQKKQEFMDRVILRKRALIESINDVLKNICSVEHSRHRSFDNFIGNFNCWPIAYSFLDSKPSVKIHNMLPNIGVA